jgi:hypothetical protein
MIGHPQLRERLRVAKRTLEEARHELGDLDDEGQFIGRGLIKRPSEKTTRRAG